MIWIPEFKAFISRRLSLLVLATSFLCRDNSISCSAETAPLVEAKRGMVVSVNPEASDAGLQVLQAGGNAVDAAVTVALSLAVTFPEAGNIGGGGFMMVWPGSASGTAASSDPVCIEYRETCPAAISRDSFINEHRQDITQWVCRVRYVAWPWRIRNLGLARGQSW
jgi:gamma-glutamyltranspeptidase